MSNGDLNWIANFIWGIADDVLRDLYVRGKYRDVILSGITDAVALAPDGKIEVVVDWKSDVSPTNALREKYRTQVRDYLDASGATRGLLVYMTLGQVEEVLVG